jgi:hypothetical protein
MRTRAVLQLVVLDVILASLLFLVEEDRASRVQYFQSLGFAPSTSYLPLVFITRAVRGSTFIPGLWTIDWSQVLIILLLFLNASFFYSELRRRSGTKRRPNLTPEGHS